MTPEETYRASPRLNWSKLKLLERSPEHFKMGFAEDSSAFALGTAVHMAILEPARFAEEYIVTTVRRDERTKAWQEFQADATRNGKTILNQSEMDKTLRIRDAVRSHSKADEYLSNGKAEVPLEWEISGQGFHFECKGRADFIGSAVVDLKTTQCASPKAFARSCAKYGYFGQAAFYSDGSFLSSGERRPFVFVAVESAPPHIVTVFTVPPAVLEAGREQYTALLSRLDYCIKRGWWKGYEEAETVELTLPHYLENE